VRERRLGRDAAVDRRGLPEALDPVEVGEDRELPDQDLGRFGQRVLRLDRAVGRDVQRELVVVRPLPDAGRLDLVCDATPASSRARGRSSA